MSRAQQVELGAGQGGASVRTVLGGIIVSRLTDQDQEGIAPLLQHLHPLQTAGCCKLVYNTPGSVFRAESRDERKGRG